MAFYKFDGEGKPLGRILRTGLDNYRDGVNKLQRIKGILNQASDAQLADVFGFADGTEAAAAKAELLSDIPAFGAAQQQMLDQFG
jgi:hypothetical protein